MTDKKKTPCKSCEVAWCSQGISADGKKTYIKGCIDTCEKAREWLMDECEPRKEKSDGEKS